MVLQRLLLPRSEICGEEALYFKNKSADIDNLTYDIETGLLLFKHHGVCDFATYFNSFSLNKWKYNTDITSLSLHLKAKGEFIIQFFQNTVGKVLHTKLLFSEHFVDEIDVPFDVENGCGVLSFRIECLSEEGRFISGEFYTNDEPVRNPKILMAVCTFRREEYILHNLKQVTEYILENKNSIVKDALDVIVSDNGYTLPTEGFNKYIKIVPNRNLGGSGGFTRGMMELINTQKEKQYTHILMADDDIRFDPLVFEKLYALLSYLKPMYRESFVGGAMLILDEMTIQSENSNIWENRRTKPVKYRVDLSDFANVCKNETPNKANYLGWWFCCIPVGVVTKTNLPLPVFIKRDDVEYGLRNGSKFITLNGINVWHEAFDAKRVAYLEYYYIRNELILEATIKKNFSKKGLLDNIKKRFLEEVFKFRYVDFKFYAKGIFDFCRGVDYFKSIDGVALNNELRAMDRKLFPLEELNIPFDMDKYLASIPYVESKWHLMFRRLTLNGWLLPSKKEPAIVKSIAPRKLAFYRVTKALNVELSTQRGYITYKSWKDLFECYRIYRDLVKFVNKYYNHAVREYVDRWRELVSYEFWENYLFGEPEKTEKVLPAIVKVNPKLNARKLEYYFKCIKTMKIDPKIIYLESRKGTDFASNVYAVAKELIKNPEYKGYKVYLIYTKESKAAIENKIKFNNLTGIKLLEKDSFEFYKIVATAKYLFTDFNLFQQYIKREGQVVVSMWHGTPLKTLGKDCKTENQTAVQRVFYLADYHVYPGQYMEDKILDVYWLNNIYQGKILETGYPRNGLIFDEKRREEIRNELHLEGKTAIIYMPTFRGKAALSFDNVKQSKMIEEFLDEIDASLNDNQIFYLKLHNYNRSMIDCTKYKHIVDAPSKYDNYEFQSACDIMISDYSSVFFDFAVCRRKIILFQYDLDTYLEERGICMPLEEIPFPIVADVKNLIKEINTPINYDDTAFLKKFATFDNINAAKLLCSRVVLGKELPKPFTERSVEHNGKKNIFIFTGDLRTRQSSLEFWDLMNTLDFSKANYFLFYYEPVMWKNPYRIEPADERFAQISMWSYTSYTKKDKELRDKYVLERDISDKVKKPLMAMHSRELRKHFGGQVHCDVMVLWKCLDPNFALMFDQFAEHKVCLYADGFGIYDKALVDSLQNYHYVTNSEFIEFMNEGLYMNEEIKHFVEPVPEEEVIEGTVEEQKTSE